jgi:hypothetical protein
MDISKPKRLTMYAVQMTLTVDEARDYISNVGKLMAQRTAARVGVPERIPADSPVFRMQRVCQDIVDMEEDEEEDV